MPDILTDLSPPALAVVIQPVEDRQALVAWADTFAKGYGLPESMAPAYLALLDSLGTRLPLHGVKWGGAT